MKFIYSIVKKMEDEKRKWIFSSSDIQPVSVWQIDYKGCKEIKTAILKPGLNIGDRVFVGEFEPIGQFLKGSEEMGVFENPLAVAKSVRAAGKVEKITSRTIWIKIGNIGSEDFPPNTLVKVPYTKVGKPIAGSRADVL